MTLGSIQSLAEMSTRVFPRVGGVRAAGAWGRQPNDFHVPILWRFWEPQPPGALRACPGLQWNSFFYLICFIFSPSIFLWTSKIFFL